MSTVHFSTHQYNTCEGHNVWMDTHVEEDLKKKNF